MSRGDHLVRKDGGKYDAADFDANPQEYASTFAEQVMSVFVRVEQVY